MRKMSFLTILLFMGFLTGFAQQTTAPDQSTNQIAGNTVVNQNTNINTNDTTPVTEEKEVVASEGVTYNDGSIDYASGDVKFVLNAQDENSGVKQIYVMVDDTQFGFYSDPITFDVEGKHVIAYKVENNVGNVTPVKYYNFILDKTSPVVNITSDKKPMVINGTTYVGPDFNLILSANDTLSGVKNIEFGKDGGELSVYSEAIPVSGDNGKHSVSYKATDNVGNIAEEATYEYFLDKTPPSVEFNVEPAAFNKDGVNFISGSTLISITANDADTGIASIKYSIDNGNEMDYSYAFKLDSGKHTVTAKAYDLMGNVSEEVSLAVTVDTGVPQVELVPTK